MAISNFSLAINLGADGDTYDATQITVYVTNIGVVTDSVNVCLIPAVVDAVGTHLTNSDSGLWLSLLDFVDIEPGHTRKQSIPLYAASATGGMTPCWLSATGPDSKWKVCGVLQDRTVTCSGHIA